MKQHFAMFAAYNRWANGRLYDAAAGLSEEEWRRDVSAFFTSICGTLNHILVADRIWLGRFTGKPSPHRRLDETITADRSGLRALREAEDGRIAAFVDALDDAALSDSFTYTTVTDGKTVTQRLAPALSHLFNHQTHHRGQAHGILSQLGREPPALDLIYFQRQFPEFR